MSKIKLVNVRLSFPSLFNRSTFEGKEGKFEATFLLNKETDAATIKKLDDAIKAAIKEAKIKVGADRLCLKDGDDSEYDGYENHMSFKAASSKRPTLINRDKTPIVEDDDVLYAGCYVNAIVDLWVQNNNYGKRINANLYGVQFVKDGEAFGNAPQDVTGDFDELDDDNFENSLDSDDAEDF
jgi:hypothetical protein